MHHVDRDTPWDEVWQAMDLLVAQGKVIYVGSSNFAGWHIAQANEAARRRNSLGLVSEQSLYNLQSRTVELEVLPACEAYGVGVIPWSPLGGGLLGGAVGQTAEGRAPSDGMKLAADWLRDHARGVGEALRRARRATGRRRARVAAAPTRSSPRRSSVRARSSSSTGPLRALDITLDDEALERLDKIFPGPGGAGARGLRLVTPARR